MAAAVAQAGAANRMAVAFTPGSIVASIRGKSELMPFSRIRLTAAALLICGGGGAAVAPRGIAALAYAAPGLSRRADG